MDRAAQLASSSNLGVFKEPRGFIRVLQFILAICAFATTVSPSSYSQFTVPCAGADPVEQKMPFSYPFKLTESAKFDVPVCATVKNSTTSPCCDYNNPAEFYVFVGVMAFLYSLAAMVLYVIFDDTYRSNQNIPTADFLLTAVFTLLWLISSSAWADGVAHIKQYIDPAELFLHRMPECSADGSTCTVNSTGNFGQLNASLMFGFLNAFVWGGSCWFLFKESRWFTRGGEDAQADMAPQQEQQHI